MLDGFTISLSPEGPGLAARLTAPAPLPLDRLLTGRPATEVAETLPRLFSLCRAAQGAAAHLTLDLPPQGDAAALADELRRDHLLKLLLVWPRLMGLPVSPLPRPRDMAEALFGPGTHLPDSPPALDAWLARGEGTAPLIAALRDAFAPGEAVADLPLVSDETALSPVAVENAPAIRHPGHPLLEAVAASHGRGPLWRALARLVDIAATLDAPAPAPRRLPDGTALAPAARGLYALRLSVRDGQVTAIARCTPTDHMLAPGGMLEQSFATLPAAKRGLAPVVLDLLDPCIACELTEPTDA